MILDRDSYENYIRQDLMANSRTRPSGIASLLKKALFPDYIWLFIVALRKAEYAHTHSSGFWGGVRYAIRYRRYRQLSIKLGFTIPLHVFGPGLSLSHYGTIVINPACKIGKNCRVHVGVNIGASGGSAKAPLIGDNVYLGPGAILFGDIVIADNVTVAANSTVTRSITTANVTVAGSPAKIIKKDSVEWWRVNHLTL